MAPSIADVHIEDVHRAGGIIGILGELDRAGLLDTAVSHRARADPGRGARSAGTSSRTTDEAVRTLLPRRARRRADTRSPSARSARYDELDTRPRRTA